MHCTGSANLELAIPGWVEPITDPNAGMKAEGTKVHELMEHIVGEYSPTQMEHIIFMLDYVATLRRKRRFKVAVEHKMTAEWLPSKPGTTVDLILHVQDELHILDYKWGAIPVDAYSNIQGLFYAACAAQEFAPKAKEVTIHILQPRAKVRSSSWTVSVAELAQFMNDAIETDELILAKDTTLSPSDHCTFCPANPHSRGDKGRPLCPPMMDLLYPNKVDLEAMLDEED